MTPYFIEDLQPGMQASSDKVISETDIENFAQVSGDFNPVHMNEDYASKTFFKGRIAHGMLSASFISMVLGTKLPGPGCIYISQTLKFLAPVRIGDTVHTRVEITQIDPVKRRASFRCVCQVLDKIVVEGEAMVFVPSRA